MTFEAIRKHSAPEMAADQILKKITTGELPPGGRLPAQRDLAQQLGVGRSSVREALNALVVMGYLETIQGSGTYVRAVLPDTDPSTDSLDRALRAGSLFDLMEAREVLECSSAALAAERAEPAQVRRLEGVIQAVEATAEDYDVFLDADIDFHRSLADATGNVVICEMTRLILEKVVAHHQALHTARLSPEYRAFSIRSARRVVAHVKNGDGKAAADWMRHHLNAIRDELKEVV